MIELGKKVKVDELAYADLSSASYKFKEIKLLTLQSTTLQTQLQVSLQEE